MKAISLSVTRTHVKALWALAFASLTFIGAKIEIPVEPVPYTLQTFFVILSGAFLGPVYGAASQILYLAVGALGVPVFAGPVAGIAKLFGPTGGYLLSFPVASFLTGYLIKHSKNYLWVLFSMLCGFLTIFAMGTIQLYFVLLHDVKKAIESGFLIFTFWDGIKLLAAASIYNVLNRNFKPYK